MPDFVDQSLLTTWSGVTGLGGAQMYELYLRMWNKKDGWWWKAFGAGGYSIWDFISTIAYSEAGYQGERADIMAEAGARWYYESATVWGTPGTLESVLNWWGAFSQSAKNTYNGELSGEIPGGTIADAQKMSAIGNGLRNPGEWAEGFDPENPMHPYGWANLSGWFYNDPDETTKRKALIANPAWLYINSGSPADFRSGKQFVVPSGCAWFAAEYGFNHKNCK